MSFPNNNIFPEYRDLGDGDNYKSLAFDDVAEVQFRSLGDHQFLGFAFGEQTGMQRGQFDLPFAEPQQRGILPNHFDAPVHRSLQDQDDGGAIVDQGWGAGAFGAGGRGLNQQFHDLHLNPKLQPQQPSLNPKLQQQPFHPQQGGLKQKLFEGEQLAERVVLLSPHPQEDVLPSPNSAPVKVGAAPPYVEQYTTFISTRAPAIIVQTLIDKLDTMPQVDYFYSDGTSKVKGVCYEGDGCTFQVNVFTHMEQGVRSNLVEFQRRKGCCISFHRFFGAIVPQLTAVLSRPYRSRTAFAGAATPTKTNNPNNNWTNNNSPAAASPATTSSDSKEIVLDQDSATSLLEMAASPHWDVRQQALLALAKCSGTAANQKLLAEGKIGDRSMASIILDIAGSTLVGGDGDARRCAVTLLASVSECHSFRPLVTSDLPAAKAVIRGLVSVLDEPLDSTNLFVLETKRQCARCFANVAQTNAESLLACSADCPVALMVALRQGGLGKREDATYLKSATDALQRLEACNHVV